MLFGLVSGKFYFDQFMMLERVFGRFNDGLRDSFFSNKERRLQMMGLAFEVTALLRGQSHGAEGYRG